jgi:hypothetical protein
MTVLPSTTTQTYDPAVRKLLVVSGGAGSFTERDGTAYQVSTTDGTAFGEPGTLADCTSAQQRGCVDRSGPNPVARMSGHDQLAFPGGKVVITGPAKTYDVEVISAP